MESLSKIKETVRLPLTINLPPYLMDHQFRGKAVLPAVEAMEILAVSTLNHLPETAVHSICNAKFDKFLIIKDGQHQIKAFNDLEVFENGTVISKLITKTKSKKALITRTRVHAALCFHGVSCGSEPSPLEIQTVSEHHIPFATIYQNLVPFGPSYHNLKGVTLFKKSAIGAVYAPVLGDSEGLLGSPFPLDAAFHAACVWGQHHAGLVGFPVAFGLRRLFVPTCSGNTYTAKIFPKEVLPDRFLVDIWITDTNGTLQEVAFDVVMKDGMW